MPSHVLAIDQGTTSSRAIVFDEEYSVVAVAQREFTQHFPQSGWVEHDPDEIWDTVVAVCREALDKASLDAGALAAVGVTNQRETAVVWDRATGKPIHNAIVWQDRRTSARCAELKAQGAEKLVRERTGLVLDPYFSATKVEWLLNNVDGAAKRAARGELAFGTIDSFLLWRLTGGRAHATDATNAARTMLFDIHQGRWDPELLSLFGVPEVMLPEVKDCAADFGTTEPDILGGAVPVAGMAGDQHAATVGQACFRPGMIKSTYGTGCFAVLNTGDEPVASESGMLTTIAYRLDGKTIYALEGAIFIAGAAVQWLRDGLGVIATAGETAELAEDADPNHRVYLVPAFVGLGAPHWDPDARGALFGLTRNSGPAELARAALESVGYQTRDLLEAMGKDWPGLSGADEVLRVDGGMVASDWTMQFLSDILDVPVDRPEVLETTALGAAYLAGMRVGLYPEPDAFSKSWRRERRFAPDMARDSRDGLYSGWRDAVARTLAK